MLRITQQCAHDGHVLKFEGRLSGAWVSEAERSWRAATPGASSRIVVDLTDVSLVDAAGHALLERMLREGVRFVTGGCLIPELVREISECCNG